MLQRVVWEQRYRWGRAYRGGRLVCARVHVVIVSDVRIAPSPPVRQQLRIRFLAGVDRTLQDELEQLARSRGMRSRRLVEQFDPVKIVWEEPPHGWGPGGRRSHVGRLEAGPIRHAASLEEVDFRLRPADP